MSRDEGSLDDQLEANREAGRRHGLELGRGFDRDMLAWTVARYEGTEREQAYQHGFTAATLGALRERLAELDARSGGGENSSDPV